VKLCLVGSTRFMDQYREVNRKLTLLGHVIYTVAAISTKQADEKAKAEEFITPEQKMMLDLVHLRKIAESEGVVLITDETGYYGESTTRELMWAHMVDKRVYFPDDLDKEPKWFGNDFKEWVKARSSKDPDAMTRYYDRINAERGGGLVYGETAEAMVQESVQGLQS